MKNKTLESKTDTQPSPSPYQTERAEAQQTPGFRPDPPGATLAPPGSEATIRAHAAGLTPATAGRILRRLQRQYGNRYVQRVVELVQRQSEAGGFQLDDETAGCINRARAGGQPLAGTVQAQMSEALGHDFSGVRVHTDSDADILSQQLSARAFTTGHDIFFRHGEYNPGSGGGRALIAHELTHVVQQSTGGVSGDGSGLIVRPAGDAFEREAGRVAEAALRSTSMPAQGRSQHAQHGVPGRRILPRAEAIEGNGSLAGIMLWQRRFGFRAGATRLAQGLEAGDGSGSAKSPPRGRIGGRGTWAPTWRPCRINGLGAHPRTAAAVQRWVWPKAGKRYRLIKKKDFASYAVIRDHKPVHLYHAAPHEAGKEIIQSGFVDPLTSSEAQSAYRPSGTEGRQYASWAEEREGANAPGNPPDQLRFAKEVERLSGESQWWRLASGEWRTIDRVDISPSWYQIGEGEWQIVRPEEYEEREEG